MRKPTHSFTELFKQLGLANDAGAMASFLNSHCPLKGTIRLEQASFWSASQRDFLSEQLAMDSDWAALIDRLSLALR